jgi:hypothetical protein
MAARTVVRYFMRRIVAESASGPVLHSTRPTVKSILRVCTAAIGVLVALVLMEAAVRTIDGDKLFALRLTAARSATPRMEASDAAVRRYVGGLPVADGVSRDWFARSPDPLPHPPLSSELAAVAEQIRPLTVSSEMFKRWNTRFIQERVCGGDLFFRQFPGFAFSYDPPEPVAHPPYRYLPGVATPYGLVTNRFGFRGHEIAADKPDHVIRIAFVGASTTVGSHSQAFSYPEFIEPWLNLWTRANAPGVRFEIVNAGREGISSPDIAAIIRQELAPLEPDVILYHEGANQFTFRELIEEAGEPIVVPAALGPRTALPGSEHFALVRRADVLLQRIGRRPGSEPAKPPYRLKWPASVDEAHPEPDASALPLHLPQIVRDLDDIRLTADASGATLVVSSFVWMVKDGLVVDPVNHAALYTILNLRHWPARYADIRRMADFQNRVFRAYADSRHVPFVDVAASFPLDVGLFGDPVHMTPDGERLRAWIVFQGLVPIVRERLAAGLLPRRDRKPFPTVLEGSALQRASLECRDFSHHAPVTGALTLGGLRPNNAEASVSGDGPMRVVTPPARYAYAAEAAIAAFARKAEPGVVHVRLRVVSGQVTVGVLNTARSSFLFSSTLAAAAESTDLYLPISSLADAGFLMITNAVRQDGERSIVEVEELGLLSPAPIVH